MAKSRDLFDDSTMSFGEHLEVLRFHLIRALVGLVICVVTSLFFGDTIVAVIRKPIDDALKRHGMMDVDAENDAADFDFWDYLFGEGDPENSDENPSSTEIQDAELSDGTLIAYIKLDDLLKAISKQAPEKLPNAAQPSNNKNPGQPKLIEVKIQAPWLAKFQKELAAITDRQNKPVTLNVQEAFMAYLKVSVVSGFVIASPWIFYQLWLFVAAGLYPNERRYVHFYLPVSIGLFLSGVAVCFFGVFPLVLSFLLSFNKLLHVVPQIRLSEWLSFAIMLPVMFGLSFQLPLVMLFLERISIFDANDFREKRRFAVLVIAIASMLMTPADPGSMIMMMIPMLGLYELGILMCGYKVSKSPFDEETE